MELRDYKEIELFGEKLKLFQRTAFEVQALDGFIRDNYGVMPQLNPFDYSYVNCVIISDSLMPNVDELKKQKFSWFRFIKNYKLKKKINVYKNLFDPKILQKTFSSQKLEELKEKVIFDVEKADRESVKKKAATASP